MSGSREEERRKLADIINHWNANRLDLFEISQPTEVSPWTFPEHRPHPSGERQSFLSGKKTRGYACGFSSLIMNYETLSTKHIC